MNAGNTSTKPMNCWLKKYHEYLKQASFLFSCCGESLEIRESGSHLDFVKQQLTASLFDLDPEDVKRVIIAYEPIWAIGTGKTSQFRSGPGNACAFKSTFK